MAKNEHRMEISLNLCSRNSVVWKTTAFYRMITFGIDVFDTHSNIS